MNKEGKNKEKMNKERKNQIVGGHPTPLPE